MDGVTLKNYVNILKEIDIEKTRIAALEKKLSTIDAAAREVTDKVTTGKRGKKPLGTVTIHGQLDYSPQNAVRERLRKRLAVKRYHEQHLEELTDAVEDFIYSIEDPEMRLLISLYCLDGHIRTWAEVAEEMGGRYTAGSCRKAFRRFMDRQEEQEAKKNVKNN